MKGILLGVGVGPGDPELLTLKAMRAIQAADVIACPEINGRPGHACMIAEKAVPEITRKERLLLSFPMSDGKHKEAHLKAADQIKEVLNAGMNVAFLTLGDPGLYSTFSYISDIILQDGYDVRIVSGVPSFCAASAKLRVPLAEGKESVLLSAGEVQDFSGTQIVLKAGSRLSQLKENIRSMGKTAWLIENCGMEGERIYCGADSFPDEAGYFSLMIVK